MAEPTDPLDRDLTARDRLAVRGPVQAAEPPRVEAASPRYWVNALLFALTVLTVFQVGAESWVVGNAVDLSWTALLKGQTNPKWLLQGWIFAVPLLSILLAHEFGHYIAARIHRVPASLPYFIPIPLPPFGTMGAIIRMRGRIASRNVLLDVGAAGPLAGMAVAIPVIVWGLLHSEVHQVTGHGMQEGQCLLYSLLKWLTVGPIPEGHDVFLHPVALAGWTGLFVTMINLLPVGQLDGGHIAYALFGPKQNKLAALVHGGLLPTLFAVNVGLNLARSLATNWGEIAGQPTMQALKVGALLLAGAATSSAFWLVWFVVLRFIGRAHPPTEEGDLSPVRTLIAVASLVLFVLLFMPTPMSTY